MKTDSNSVRIWSKGTRAYPILLRLILTGFATLGIWLGVATAVALHGGETLILVGVIAPVASMVVLDLGLEEYFANRWVEVTEGGILAAYRFHRTFAPWTRLAPLKDNLINQTGFLFDRGGGRRTQLVVTYDQMRAILSSPYAPKWEIEPRLAARLGVGSIVERTSSR
jgi:hypothetical protein